MNKLGIRRRFSKLKRSSTPLMQFVDLGLPSGTLWATTNIGAKTPYEAGLYFAWGETDGCKGKDVGTKRNFVLTEYKYYGGTLLSSLTKYNDNDLKTILDLEDDAAFVNCGGNWRMPTKEQFAELINDEYVTKVYDSANLGYIITSKINGNSIFLVSSSIAMSRPVDVGYAWTAYLSNERNSANVLVCYAMKMHPLDLPAISEYYGRYLGYNIRPVRDRILTFTAKGDNNRIAIKKISTGSSSQALPNAQLEYSLDNGKTWLTMSISNSWNTYYVTVEKGLTLKLRGINNKIADYLYGNNRYHYFIMTGLFEASGDVTSLLNNVGGDLSLADKGNGFLYLFKDCTSLITAPNLPSTTLCTSAYSGMFSGCTRLTKAPNSLPALNVPALAYASMFMNCTSLTIVPQKLPATTLGSQFTYASMFKGCTSLTRAPEIANITYNGSENLTGMFQDCVNLSYVKAMFDPLVITYTRDWLSNVSPTGVFVKNPDVKWDRVGGNGIPVGWNIISGELKFTAEQANSTISLIQVGAPKTISLECSMDGGNTWNTHTLGNIITLVNIGDSVKFRGTNSTFSSGTYRYYYFQMSGKIAASGDVTSLLNGVGGDIDLTGKDYCFYKLFYNCRVLTTAPKLPSTILATYCYNEMFYNCSALAEAPELPATTLTSSCYRSMFYGCTSLTTTPELPATSLAYYCYQQMFSGCTSLTTAQKLPATTLVDSCYQYMFNNCTLLVTAPELPATTLAQYCYNYMFNNCISLTIAPELPATTLVLSCYSYMFFLCTNLSYIKAMFTTTPSTTYTNGWVAGVAATGTFVKNSEALWDVAGGNGIPSGWTVETASE